MPLLIAKCHNGAWRAKTENSNTRVSNLKSRVHQTRWRIDFRAILALSARSRASKNTSASMKSGDFRLQLPMVMDCHKCIRSIQYHIPYSRHKPMQIIETIEDPSTIVHSAYESTNLRIYKTTNLQIYGSAGSSLFTFVLSSGSWPR